MCISKSTLLFRLRGAFSDPHKALVTRIEYEHILQHKSRGPFRKTVLETDDTDNEEESHDIDISINEYNNDDCRPCRGHPFMTSTRRGREVRLKWTHVDWREGGIKPHVDVHTEN